MHTDEIENRNVTWVNHWPREKALANVALYAYSKSKILVIVQMTSDWVRNVHALERKRTPPGIWNSNSP